MSFVLLSIVTYAAAVLQTALGPALEIRHVMPDFFVLAAVLWLLTTTVRRAFVAVAIGGLAYDLTAAAPPGVGLAAFALVGFAIEQIKAKLDTNHFAVRLAAVFAATTVIALVEALAARLSDDAALTSATLIVRAISVAAYTAGVAVPVLMIIGWLPRRRGETGELPLPG
jgi:rod shape-determining protein MreD